MNQDIAPWGTLAWRHPFRSKCNGMVSSPIVSSINDKNISAVCSSKNMDGTKMEESILCLTAMDDIICHSFFANETFFCDTPLTNGTSFSILILWRQRKNDSLTITYTYVAFASKKRITHLEYTYLPKLLYRGWNAQTRYVPWFPMM